MLKKSIKYLDLEKTKSGYDEIEKEETIRFIFTLAAVRLYEQKTGNLFFNDYSKAWKVFTDTVKDLDIKDFNNIPVEKQLKLTPILFDQTINGFLMNIIPCVYVEIHDGKFIQNEETVNIAENSMWIMELVNIGFFTELFKELSANQTKGTVKSVNKGKKE